MVWRRQFKAITRYETEDGEWKEGEIMDAVPIYEPEEERGKRGRGPGRPKQVCMQAAGEELRRDLAKEERAMWEVEVYGPQDIKRMWTGVTRGS